MLCRLRVTGRKWWSSNRGKSITFLVLVILVAIQSILSLTHEGYARATSLRGLASHFTWPSTSDRTSNDDTLKSLAFHEFPPTSNTTIRANATLLMLARNSEIDTAAQSVRELEERFNHRFGYPWTFLNDEPFTDEFKERMSGIVSGPIQFGLVPPEHWNQPEWIDPEKAAEGRRKLVSANVIYGGSVSYRNMCRFNSGFFYRHHLLQKYKWYWRVEPNVHFHCDVEVDPFNYMERTDRVYGFTISPYEWDMTIPTLWSTVKDFMNQYPEHISPDNAMGYISDNNGETYNLCHFWSNFEIANMDFWRGEAYSKFFDFLDATGGFYYERWGDAPVHTIGVGLLARKDQIYFFDEIGYEHAENMHCPQNPDYRDAMKCSCDFEKNFDYGIYSCLPQWDRIH